MVLLTEVRSEGEGIVWLGEANKLTAIIHSQRAAILLNGDSLKSWCEQGQRKKVSNRTVSVKINELLLVSTYQPVYLGNNAEEIEIEKDTIKEHVGWADKDNIVMVGGDLNAHVGGNSEREDVCGKFGLRETNTQGQWLIEWCEENDMTYVNSFYSHRNRGTWFNNLNGRWYELDGFLMKKQQRHKHVIKVKTIRENTISDHKPKSINIKINIKKWRVEGRKKRAPRIKWESLRDPTKERMFRVKTEELMRERRPEQETDSIDWNELSHIMMKAAEEVCGKEEKQIENEWMIGKEEELREMRARIQTAIERRNEMREMLTEGDHMNTQAEIEKRKQELRRARRHMKREIRQWENDWWEEIISECERAGETGEQGRLYKQLRKLGRREMKKTSKSTTITTERFRTHFKDVSKDRFENRTEEIERIANEIEDLSQTERVTQWRGDLEETPSREEIFAQMKQLRESAPVEDGVRLSYILKAGPTVKAEITQLIQKNVQQPIREMGRILENRNSYPTIQKRRQ